MAEMEHQRSAMGGVRATEQVDGTVLPIVEERLDIATHAVKTGAMRVRVEADEHLEQLSVDVASTRYQQVVVAIDRPVDQRVEPWHDGDDLVIPIYEERAVIERRLFLKEEIRLRKIRSIDHRHESVVLHRDRATIERQQPDGTWAEVGTPPTGPTVLKQSSNIKE